MQLRISTLAALCLDFWVRRQNNQRGIYRLHDLDTKQQQSRPEATRGPFTDGDGNGSYGAGGINEPRESEAWEAPRSSFGPYREQSSSSRDASGQGYAVPEGQFGYDDTKYYGGHQEKP